MKKVFRTSQHFSWPPGHSAHITENEQEYIKERENAGKSRSGETETWNESLEVCATTASSLYTYIEIEKRKWSVYGDRATLVFQWTPPPPPRGYRFKSLYTCTHTEICKQFCLGCSFACRGLPVFGSPNFLPESFFSLVHIATTSSVCIGTSIHV